MGRLTDEVNGTIDHIPRHDHICAEKPLPTVVIKKRKECDEGGKSSITDEINRITAPHCPKPHGGKGEPGFIKEYVGDTIVKQQKEVISKSNEALRVAQEATKDISRIREEVTTIANDAKQAVTAANSAAANAEGVAARVQGMLERGELNGKDGKTPEKGKDYDDGVGIASIKIKQSDEKGGRNEVAITLTNNERHVFTIHNGEDYTLTENDKKDIADVVVRIVGDDFARKEDVVTVKIAQAKPQTPTEAGVDGLVTALDVKEYTSDMLRYEESSNIITI